MPIQPCTRASPRNSEFASLDPAPDETAVAGLLDNRVFHLRFGAQAPDFLTSDLDTARHPVWHADGHSVVFSVLERGVLIVQSLLADGDLVRVPWH